MGKKNINNKSSIKTLGIIAGLIFTAISTMAGAAMWVDGLYVHQDLYNVKMMQNEKELVNLENKTASLVMAMQEAAKQEMNKVYQAIKAASALPLIVRRDVLISRGNDVSDSESAELEIIREKLNDLNIQ